jgi:hypothetical protein
MATLEELAGLAALIMGSRQQHKQINRANRTKLEQMRQEQELQRQRFEAQKQAQDREQAWAEAKPFLDAFMGPNSADILSNMANQGNVGGFLDNAQSAFKRAGFPFDVSRYRVRAPQTEVDLSGVGRGSQAPPVGASPEGVMPTRQPMEASGTPVPRFNQLPPDMAGPPTPIANLPDERLRLLFGGLPQGMQGPPTPVSAMSPEPEPPTTPAVEPFDEEEAYRERYQPGVLTQAKLGDYASKASERLFKRGLYTSQMEKNAALAEATRLLAHPRAMQALAQAGYTEQRTATDALLMNARLRTEIAKALNYEATPGLKAEGHAVQRERIQSSEEIAAAGNKSREKIAASGQQSRERIASGKLEGQVGKVPAEQQATYRIYLKIVSTPPGTNPISGLPEEKYTPEEVETAKAGLRSMGQRYGIDLSGIPGLEDYTRAAAPAPPAAAPARDSATPRRTPLTNAQRQQLIQKLVKQGVPKAKAIELAGKHSGG